jgi:hypothetical protein
MEVIVKIRKADLIAKWMLLLAVACIGLLRVNTAYAAARANEPPTIICNSCNLEEPYAGGASNDVRTTLGVLTWAASVGNVRYFPWGGPGAAICRESAVVANSRCIVYWFSGATGLWTGSDDNFLTDSFCMSHFNDVNWPYDRCVFDPQGTGAPPPESQPIRGPICIVGGIPAC